MARIRFIDEYDMINSFWGNCVSVWFQGCEHHCKGCFNPETWNENDKTILIRDNKDIINDIVEKIDKYFPKDLSFLGGDPLATYNRNDLLDIILKVKEKRPNTRIAIWTGYLWEDVKDLEIMNHINILIDGKFIEELNIKDLKHKGSTNQRIIDVKESLKNKKIIILK